MTTRMTHTISFAIRESRLVRPDQTGSGSFDAAAHPVDIRHLFISKGHNFRAHHGRPAGTNPVVEVAQLECVAGRGIIGDRYFDFEECYKGQITFLDACVHRHLCQALGIDRGSPSALRRNVVIEGVDLNTLIGKEFEIDGVWFFGTEECRPCYWMDRAVAPGAEDFLRGRGGLRARILTTGLLAGGQNTLTAVHASSTNSEVAA